jgi:hypothetical protein
MRAESAVAVPGGAFAPQLERGSLTISAKALILAYIPIGLTLRVTRVVGNQSSIIMRVITFKTRRLFRVSARVISEKYR